MHMAWGLESLRSQLQALCPGMGVEVLAEATSTNTLLLEAARQHPRAWLLVAETQTAGRGRLGRAWQAQPGASLTFSIGLPLAPRQWQGLSLAVGLALAEALDPLSPDSGRPALGLKWPNDLWRWDGPGRGRKLGGVLIETTALGTGVGIGVGIGIGIGLGIGTGIGMGMGGAGGADGTAAARYCVVGVGLNIAPFDSGSADRSAGGSPNANPTACLQELHPGLTPPEALARVAPTLLRTVIEFQAEGFAALAAAYARRDLLQGQAIHSNGPPALAGVAAGVDAEGALCVQDGPAMHRVIGGEVSVRFAGVALPPWART